MKHFYKLYEKDEELVKIVSIFLKEGLDKGEFCFWAVPDSLPEEKACSRLKDYIELLDLYLKNGNIKILNACEWYRKDGCFDVNNVFEKWKNVYEEAMARGFTGLRVIGVSDNIRERDWENIMRYEARINSMINEYPNVTALCAYNTKNLKSIIHISDIVNTHEACYGGL